MQRCVWNHSIAEIAELFGCTDVTIQYPDAPKPCPLLFQAIRSGQIDTVKSLIQNGSVVNAKDENGNTPLHWAVWYENLEIVRCLFSNGADIDARNNRNETPLHFSGMNDGVEVAQFLVSQGADTNAQNNGGDEPGIVAFLWDNWELSDTLSV